MLRNRLGRNEEKNCSNEQLPCILVKEIVKRFFEGFKNQLSTFFMGADCFDKLSVVFVGKIIQKIIIKLSSDLAFFYGNGKSFLKPSFKEACSGFQIAAYDSENYSEILLWPWKLFRKPAYNMFILADFPLSNELGHSDEIAQWQKRTAFTEFWSSFW